MPRKPRLIVPGYPAHIIQRGHNRDATFFEPDDYRYYIALMAEAADLYTCAVHAYVLMSNHVHLLLTPSETDSASRLIQHIGRNYVPYVNQKYTRTGTLWEGRFKSCLVASDRYVLACHRYIEMNPVRAGMVKYPGNYQWSSFNANTGRASSNFLVQHASVSALSDDVEVRQTKYRNLFATELPDLVARELRSCVLSGVPFCPESSLATIDPGDRGGTRYKLQGRPARE